MNIKKSKASTILMNRLSNCRNKLWGTSNLVITNCERVGQQFVRPDADDQQLF